MSMISGNTATQNYYATQQPKFSAAGNTAFIQQGGNDSYESKSIGGQKRSNFLFFGLEFIAGAALLYFGYKFAKNKLGNLFSAEGSIGKFFAGLKNKVSGTAAETGNAVSQTGASGAQAATP